MPNATNTGANQRLLASCAYGSAGLQDREAVNQETMIIWLLKRIEAHLAEIVRLLKTPEDFTAEDNAVKDAAKAVDAALKHLPHPDKTTNPKG